MATEEGRFTLRMEQLEDYQFNVKFDLPKAADLLLDEPPPLGKRMGPNASRLVAAAAANCLSASLMYCVAREDVPAGSVSAEATCKIIRNDKKRLRIGGMEVRITIDKGLTENPRMNRCLNLFEDFCVVTESLRHGFPVEVQVHDSEGTLLHTGGTETG